MLLGRICVKTESIRKCWSCEFLQLFCALCSSLRPLRGVSGDGRQGAGGAAKRRKMHKSVGPRSDSGSLPAARRRPRQDRATHRASPDLAGWTCAPFRASSATSPVGPTGPTSIKRLLLYVTPCLSPRTPRSGVFVVSFVASFVDKVTDKDRDKDLRFLKKLSSAQRPHLSERTGSRRCVLTRRHAFGSMRLLIVLMRSG